MTAPQLRRPTSPTPSPFSPPRGGNLKLISRRDIRKLGEIVLSGFNYLENLDSPRKFLRRSTTKWMHPGAPSGFHPLTTIPLGTYLSLLHSSLKLPTTRIAPVFLPLDQPITRLSNRSGEILRIEETLLIPRAGLMCFQRRHLLSRFMSFYNIFYGRR